MLLVYYVPKVYVNGAKTYRESRDVLGTMYHSRNRINSNTQQGFRDYVEYIPVVKIRTFAVSAISGAVTRSNPSGESEIRERK